MARPSVPRSIEDPATTTAVNVGGTANVLAAAVEGGARRVVYASSSSVYGHSDRLPKKEGEEGTPLSPYAWSKRLTEELAEAFTGSYGLEAVGLRYFNVYGPRQSPEGPYAAVIPRFFDAFLNGRQPVIYGNGEQSRDFTAVGDAVRANLLAALANQAPGGAYNVGGGRRVTVNELARAVAGTVGVDTEPRYDPPRAGDVLHSLADLEAAGKRLDYGPETGLEQGLAPCNDYYRSLFA